MRKTPHDVFFSFAFSFIQVCKDFFEQIPPKWFIEVLDIETLQPIEGTFLSQKMRKYYTDKLFSCKLKTGEEILIACLLEHKSYIPTYIYDQLQRYVVEKYEHDRKNKKPRCLVVPIVIYHGNNKWVKKPPHDAFKGIPPILRKFANAPDYILIDIGKFTKKRIMELRQGYLVNALLMLKYSYDPVYLGNNLHEVFAYGDFYETTEEGRVFIKGLLEYFFELNNFDEQTEQKMNEVIENMQQPVQQKLMSLKEIYINRGRQEGRQEGEKKGEQKKATQVAQLLLLKYPQWTNESIAEITGLTVAAIKKLREKMASSKNGQANGKANEKE